MMKMPHTFITSYPLKEPLHDQNCDQHILNEYILNDSERAVNTSIGTCVYDYVDPSPHYDNTADDLYIDEKELIEL